MLKIFCHMLSRLSKGQGMVEYALVMAFIVIVMAALYATDFRVQIKAIFDSVVEALS